MSKFKVGDKVRCVDSGTFGDLKDGDMYTVMDVDLDGLIYVEDSVSGEYIGVYMEERFVLADQDDRPDPTTPLQTHPTGAVREVKKGKGVQHYVRCGFPRLLTDLAKHMENPLGRNWEKGLPLSSYADAADRHWTEHLSGNGDAKSLISAVWNLACYYETLHRVQEGTLPQELDDIERDRRSTVKYGEDIQ